MSPVRFEFPSRFGLWWLRPKYAGDSLNLQIVSRALPYVMSDERYLSLIEIHTDAFNRYVGTFADIQRAFHYSILLNRSVPLLFSVVPEDPGNYYRDSAQYNRSPSKPITLPRSQPLNASLYVFKWIGGI